VIEKGILKEGFSVTAGNNTSNVSRSTAAPLIDPSITACCMAFSVTLAGTD
jgi:hypothetical protein